MVGHKLDGITNSIDMSFSKLQETEGKPGMLQPMGSQSQTQLSKQTTTMYQFGSRPEI